MHVIRRAGAAVLLLSVWQAGLGAEAMPVHETVLDNGLKILVREDHRAPVAVFQVWYRVGSSYEHGGITGLSHMLEHMMFKGTHQYGPNEISQVLANEGAEENAFTGRDYTAYYQKIAADRLEISFRIEADRMVGLLLDDAEFQKERDVVAEERRLRTEDRPQALVSEEFYATAFQTSPYHHPVIGWMDDIRNYSLADLSAWYHRWYAPNNATIVVVGDVQYEDIFARARKYFGALKPVVLPEPKPRREVEQRGERRVTLRLPASQPYLEMGYAVPSLATAAEPWEAYALYVLASILDQDDSARLTRDLVRGARVAASVSADYDLYARLSGLLQFSGTPAQAHTAAELELAVREQVERLRDTPVDAAELERVKTQIVASEIYQRDSVFYQSMKLGQLETLGYGWEVGEQLVAGVQAVSAEQVREVARRYLTPERLTLVQLEPTTLEVADAGGSHAESR